MISKKLITVMMMMALLTGSTASGASYSLASASLPGPADSLRTPEDFHRTKWRFVRTSGLVITVNLAQTAFGRYIMEPDEDGFKVTWDSIKENLKAGMEWDDNSFNANNWRHPYQGGMYFTAARANAYDFYQSSAFSFAGAWLWEYTGERHHPAFNDWINTAVGGITFGETLWRLSDMVIDNRATGGGRVGREIACLLLTPTREVNRILTREAFDVHQNPPGQYPSAFSGQFKAGVRVLGEEHLWNSGQSKVFIGGSIYYGEKFEMFEGKPFDYFDFHFQLNFRNSPHEIGLFNINGLLHAWDTGSSETSRSQINAYVHATYIDNEAYTFGGQSLSFSYMRRWSIGSWLEHELEANLEGIILGASKSDHFNLSNREYDYGPGAGVRLNYTLLASEAAALRCYYRGAWTHSINGTRADHWDNFLGLTTSARLRDWFRLGLDYFYYRSERYYKDYPDITAKNPMLQVYFIWNF